MQRRHRGGSISLADARKWIRFRPSVDGPAPGMGVLGAAMIVGESAGVRI